MDHLLKCHEMVKDDFVRADNCDLYDSRDNRYIDFESGIWCTALGHNHPRIVRAMRSQIQKVIHLGTRFPGPLAEEAARDILDITGIGQGKCTFLSSGSEAVEFAVQAARRIRERPLLLALSDSYFAAYGSAGRKAADEWLSVDRESGASMSGRSGQPPYAELAAFVFEPGGSGSAYVRFPPKPLVQELVRRVKEYDGLVICNEVTTGMGRTGKWFGFQHYEIEPDIIALGKGLGNGYPVSAVVMRGEVAHRLEESGLLYAQSHQNDPLGCAVAREVIAVLREKRLIERAAATGACFLEGLKRLQERYAVIEDARGRGLLLALEFKRHERVSALWAFRALLEQGFLTGYYPAGNILRFDPALTVPRAYIDNLLDCLDSLLMGAVHDGRNRVRDEPVR